MKENHFEQTGCSVSGITIIRANEEYPMTQVFMNDEAQCLYLREKVFPEMIEMINDRDYVLSCIAAMRVSRILPEHTLLTDFQERIDPNVMRVICFETEVYCVDPELEVAINDEWGTPANPGTYHSGYTLREAELYLSNLGSVNTLNGR